MLYQVMYGDKSSFDGGKSYKETKWNEIPDKPIRHISFQLPDGNFITLRGYEAYNHMIEVTQDIYGKGMKKEPIIRAQYLMGREKGKVVSYRITLYETLDSKYKINDITRREYIDGHEYNNKPTTGWKQGIK